MNRRRFMQTAAGAAAFLAARKRAYGAFAQTQPLQKFITPLPGLSVLNPVSTSNVPGCDPYNYYEIALRQGTHTFHPSLKSSRIWGYTAAGSSTSTYLGGTMVATRGVASRIRFINELPNTHILPVDVTTPGVTQDVAAKRNRAAIHLHGGFVHWTSDGGPRQWFTPGPDPAYGDSYLNWLPDAVTGNLTADYWYPNDQSARLMWYHDHAVGNTRLNAYAGLAAGYLLTDSVESGMVASKIIPAEQIPLVIQDKIFTSAATEDDYSDEGDLWYPRTYDTQFFALAPANNPLPQPSLVPEFWGDTIIVNGTAYPYADVQPRRYRLRILNGCNTRFLSLRLVAAKGRSFPDNTEPDLRDTTPVTLTMIGNECGFLDGTANPRGVPVGTAARPLVLAPAERADIIIDFSKAKPGMTYLLHNDAPVPFPGGTPLADFYPGNPKLLTAPAPGFGPNTRTILQFRVGAGSLPPNPAPATWALPALENPNVPAGVMQPPPGVLIRDITLNEAIDAYGRLSQEIGSAQGGLFGMAYESTPTETPAIGAVEVWRISNLTADAHPMHFHLTNAQILSRQPINVRQFNGVPSFTGRARGPDPDEMGWKETVRMYPGEATTVIMKFDLPKAPVVPVGNTPTSVNIPFSPKTGGHEYVWHCHILEHEEHDMMRPLIVG